MLWYLFLIVLCIELSVVFIGHILEWEVVECGVRELDRCNMKVRYPDTISKLFKEKDVNNGRLDEIVAT